MEQQTYGWHRPLFFFFFVAITTMTMLPFLSIQTEALISSSFNSTVTAPQIWSTSDWSDFNVSWVRYSFSTSDIIDFRILLLANCTDPDLNFAVGFLCKHTSNFFGKTTDYKYTCTFGIIVVRIEDVVKAMNGTTISDPPQLLWSANRNHPVDTNSTLLLSKGEGLSLRDTQNLTIWSTNTPVTSLVTRMNLTSNGNLILLDNNNVVIWQSFRHPTDTVVLVAEMYFVKGELMIVANSSASDSTEGLYYFNITITTVSVQLVGFYNSTPPQRYTPRFSGASAFYKNSANLGSFAFGRLECDGHLRFYSYQNGSWMIVDKQFNGVFEDCDYPSVCGKYGTCDNGRCSCEGSNAYFRQLDPKFSNGGCEPFTSISCQSMEYHRLLNFPNVSFFNYQDEGSQSLGLIGEESCKEACLKNCSCKAALFWNTNGSDLGGLCYLQSQIFSLRVGMANWLKIYSDHNFYSCTTYLKVQDRLHSSSPPIPPPLAQPQLVPVLDFYSLPKKASISRSLLVGSIFGALVGVFVFVALIVVFLTKGKTEAEEEDELLELDQLSGLPTRFSYRQLRDFTKNFSVELGKGGFGHIFRGSLPKGGEIAVKKLESVKQGKKEFLAEVQTIGSIHHLNLVNLIGYCAEGKERLLVYEYLSNGSLDKWIFKNISDGGLDWQIRRRIITQVAEGLKYLHEECRQRIAHLDIKPQNILLDEHFNAKVSDFGLSKFIDRDQSCVETMMRGTPGYLAPEWLTTVITERVDVYSFGVVLLEVICSTKVLRKSAHEEGCFHLLSEVKDKASKGQLIDIISKYCSGMGIDEEEALAMLHLAMWCTQGDPNSRPSMLSVLKTLEGSITVDPNLHSGIISLPNGEQQEQVDDYSSTPAPSELSGPR